MYVHKAFQAPTDKALSYLAERAFGALVVFDGEQPIASHLPFLYQATSSGLGKVYCHVARANPLHKFVSEGKPAVLIVSGPDTFISASWYASPEQVPTWNYVSVHAKGTLRVLPQETIRSHVEALSHQFEVRVNSDKPWTLDKVSAQRAAALMAAIVPLEFEIHHIEGQWKLNQHKNDADHAAVVAALRQQSDPNAKAIAEAMDRSRLPPS